MADTLQLRIVDKFPPADVPEGDRKFRKEVHVVRAGEVLGHLSGVTRVDYSMAVQGISKVSIDVIVADGEIETR